MFLRASGKVNEYTKPVRLINFSIVM